MILCDRKWPFKFLFNRRRYDSFRSLFLPVCQFTVSEELVKTILKLLHYYQQPVNIISALYLSFWSAWPYVTTETLPLLVWQSWKREERERVLRYQSTSSPSNIQFRAYLHRGFLQMVKYKIVNEATRRRYYCSYLSLFYTEKSNARDFHVTLGTVSHANPVKCDSTCQNICSPYLCISVVFFGLIFDL